MKISRQIGEYKKNNNIAILQASRWDSLLAKVVEKGKEYGLPKNFIEDVFNAIHETSVEMQNEVISGKTSEQ
jgi:chorismate mutase